MWASIVSGLLSIFASLFKRKEDRELEMNSPEMKANRDARDEVKRQDEIETEVVKALDKDEKALKNLQHLSAE